MKAKRNRAKTGCQPVRLPITSGKFDDDNPAGDTDPTIDSMSTVDLQYAYQLGFASTRIAVGVINALNEDVPRVESNFMNYAATVHDPRGRMFYGNVTQAFRIDVAITTSSALRRPAVIVSGGSQQHIYRGRK